MTLLLPTVVALAAGALFTTRVAGSPETDLAAPGAPLYEKAVTESVDGLKSKKKQAGAQSRPPSPGPDYYWCDNCKTYHKRNTPAPAQHIAAQKPVASPDSPQQPAAVIPPSPGPEYYWCATCKTYHKRTPGQNPHAAAKMESPSTPAPQAVPAAAPGERPPSPGKDYYWCENCKTYHRRQAQEGTAPAHIPAPAAGTATNQVSGDYYYCEKCKAYHRRQTLLQPADPHIIEGITN